MKKIRHGIKRPPDDEVHAITSQKKTDETDKGRGEISDMERMHGESKCNDFGSIECQ